MPNFLRPLQRPAPWECIKKRMVDKTLFRWAWREGGLEPDNPHTRGSRLPDPIADQKIQIRNRLSPVTYATLTARIMYERWSANFIVLAEENICNVKIVTLRWGKMASSVMHIILSLCCMTTCKQYISFLIEP